MDVVNNNSDEEKDYAYYKQINELSKKGWGVRILINNNILERKFDCILSNSFRYIRDDEIPALQDVYVGDYKNSFDAEVKNFSKEFNKLKYDLAQPLRILVKYIKDIYEEVYDRLYNRIMLLLGGLNDDYVISCFTILILIEKAFIKIKNIFID